jgi:hypothetical protein
VKTQSKTQETMATGNYYTHIVEDHEEPYDWKIGPCAGMTWSEWVEIQGVDISPIDETPLETENDQGNDDQSNEDHDNHDHGNEDQGNDDQGNDDHDKHDHGDDCKTPRATHSVRRQLTFGKFVKSPAIQVRKTDSQSEIKQQPIIEHKAPQKAKTRAEKRAEEPEIEDELESSDFLTPQKKQRRTDYWVNQDDLRMKRARAFKNHQHETVAGA